MNKIILFAIIFLGLILFTSGSIYAYPTIKKMYSSYKNKNEGDKYFSSKNYKEAYEYYKKSKEEWDLKDISEKITNTKEMIEDEENYILGEKSLIEEDWEKAILSFSKVSSKYDKYENAEKLIEFAKSKKDENIDKEVKSNEMDNDNNQVLGSTTEKTEVVNNIPTEAIKQTVYVSGLNKSVNCKAEGVDAIKSADSDYVDSKLNMDKCVNEQKKVIEDCGVECLNHSMLNKQNCLNMSDVGGCMDGTTVTFNSCIEKCKKDATNEINYWQNIYNLDLKLGNLNILVIQYCD